MEAEHRGWLNLTGGPWLLCAEGAAKDGRRTVHRNPGCGETMVASAREVAVEAMWQESASGCIYQHGDNRIC